MDNYRKIKLVTQEKSTECGVACLAMLANTTLKIERRNICFHNTNDFRTYPNDLREILKGIYGIKLGRSVKTDTWSTLLGRNVTALVATRYKRLKNGEETWHWIIYNSCQQGYEILDPEKNIKTYKVLNRKISWYHLVHY